MTQLKTSRRKVQSKKASAIRYRYPRTGEKRCRRVPLWIDRLPQTVRDEIVAAREAGQTLKGIAHATSAKAGRTIPISTLQRWFDLRIDQPRREMHLRGETPALIEVLRELRASVSLLKSIAAALKVHP